MKNYRDSKINSINNRLKQLLSERNISMQQLAKLSGIAVGTIQKMVTNPNCNPTIASLEAITKVLDLPISFLIGENNNQSHQQQLPIPIFQWDQLEQQILLRLESTINPNFDHLAAIDNVSEQSFAIKMRGNAMSPMFPENTMLIFDPQKIHYDGAYVLVFLNKLNTYLFRELIIDEPDQFIKSTNLILTEKLTKLTDKDKIVATLVQAQHSY